MDWQFKREETEFKALPEGEYRIRVKSCDKSVSKSGNEMLAFQFAVSGSNSTLYHYIVFLADRPEITNRMLTQFFDSFKDIADGDFVTSHWIGKVGACKVKHDDEGRAKISYFLHADKQGNLPPWKEPTSNNGGSSAPVAAATTSDDDLPFPIF